MTQWCWQQANWTDFIWDDTALTPLLEQARHHQGQLLGQLANIKTGEQALIAANSLAEELINTSAIEGETLNRDSVRSSISRRLGLNTAGINHPPDRYIDGLLDLILDACESYQQPLTCERLHSWQAALFPTGYSGIKKITVGAWRGAGDMQIVSGRPGKITIHYLAPPYQQLPASMKQFIHWFNHPPAINGLYRAAIAHLWFEILHPYDDGNGRLGRALSELALAQDEQSSLRCYSLSHQIMQQRKQYYAILGKMSQANRDITEWIAWFLQCFQAALQQSLDVINTVMLKHRFWQHHQTTSLTDRQRKVLNRLLDTDEQSFIGGMTTRKYAHLTRCSRATAYRELKDLVTKQCLEPIPNQQGRNTSYRVKLTDLQ